MGALPKAPTVGKTPYNRTTIALHGQGGFVGLWGLPVIACALFFFCISLKFELFKL